LDLEKRRQQRKRLTVDVIDNRGGEQNAADPPAETMNQAWRGLGLVADSSASNEG
jgi:hypothetical protein